LKSITDAKILNVLTNEVLFDRVKDCGKVKGLEDLSY